MIFILRFNKKYEYLHNINPWIITSLHHRYLYQQLKHYCCWNWFIVPPWQLNQNKFLGNYYLWQLSLRVNSLAKIWPESGTRIILPWKKRRQALWQNLTLHMCNRKQEVLKWNCFSNSIQLLCLLCSPSQPQLVFSTLGGFMQRISYYYIEKNILNTEVAQ